MGIITTRRIALALLVGLIVTPHRASADGGITFTDIAAHGGAGITYSRGESPRDAIFDQLKSQPVYTMADVAITPLKSRGAPGVAILDHDGDGDEDIYVTNGPGRANSLYSNQLRESGVTTFIDVGVAAGTALQAQDSTGVCVGDTDNDGDDDIYVLGAGEPNRLLVNDGDGTFTDVTGQSEVGAGSHYSTTCSMADVDLDGYIDLIIGNSYDSWDHQFAIFVEPYAFNEHNQLLMNIGANAFVDVSAGAGLEATSGFTPAADGSPTLTWAIAAIDIDQDGDADIVHADDQAAVPTAAQGGFDRGVIHLMQNDGTGIFSDVSDAVGLNQQGSWMGLSFGDLNCDGNIDLFATNIGDYMFTPVNPAYVLGDGASRWFLGNGDGTFTDPGVGSTVASVFGWGTGISDYDNDGDQDIIYHGGLNVGPFVDASNPGVWLQNQACGADFVWDDAATSDTDHQRRNVHGMATADLNGDGFVDVVSVSNFNEPEPIPLVPYEVSYGSVFDIAAIVPTFIPTGNPGEWVFSGIELPDGDLSVELSSGDNGNGWVKVDPVGSVGTLPEARTNRGGIGAVVSFTPRRGATVIAPIVSGASYGSSHSQTAHFGLGNAKRGTVDILWPGGTRNRLYGVRDGSVVTFPEIPCSYDGSWPSAGAYARCVKKALATLQSAGLVGSQQRGRLASSAMRAFHEHRRGD
ncbi:MAG: CRTAC1 family protein [Myxococcales bacterium]|nr:CRTAC1 family protein [Myxococcales bacterium]